MKKLCLLLILSILLCACEAEPVVSDAAGTVDLFYQTAETQYGSADGQIAHETRATAAPISDCAELMALYLQGPESKQLLLPLPTGIECLHADVADDTVQIVMSSEFAQLGGTQLSIAVCCIAKTLLSFTHADRVQISAEGGVLSNGQQALTLRNDDIVLQDDGAMAGNYQLTLYFADENNRYLLGSTRIVREEDAPNLPEYLIRQLMHGPEDAGAYPVIPEGTMLLDVSVDDTICFVDFSTEFYVNRPTDPLHERMTIYSIVDTLTELDEIESVQILKEGETIGTYYCLDLSQPLARMPELIGPVRTGVGEFDATLVLPMENQPLLFACPTRLRASATKSTAQVVLDALCAYRQEGSYFSFLPEQIELLSFDAQGNNDTLDFSTDPLSACATAQQRQLCVQSIVLSIKASTGSDCAVRILVNGTPLQELYPELPAYFLPDESCLAQ